MLIFPLKKQWYEKIKNGEKTVEYREVKDYWSKRLLHANCLPFYDYNPITKDLKEQPEWCVGIDCAKPVFCKLRLGYSNSYMTAIIIRVEIIDGKDTDLHINKPVYAIHLTDVREVEE